MLSQAEKQSLVILIMEDIRGSWGWNQHDRVQLARQFATELGWQQHIDHINDYDYEDGRHFRNSFEFGGYEDPPFDVIRTFAGVSDEFKQIVNESLNYPEYAIQRCATND